MTARNRARGAGTPPRRRGGSGPIAFFVSLFIVAIGSIQLVATFHDYALDLAQLNGLKRQEAELVSRKRELADDIRRWKDKSYVAAQARERLGFVFPGEESVHVLHPEAVTGGKDASDGGDGDDQRTGSRLPWYSELDYAFAQADHGRDDGANDAAGPDGQTGANGTGGSSAPDGNGD